MPRYLWLIILAALWTGLIQAQISQEEIGGIATSIVEQINTAEPIILDIRAGEWSQALATEIKRQLLTRGADIRETGPGQHSPAFSDVPQDSLDVQEINLERFKLNSALLVLVELELRWQTVERKSFLSYSSQRKPLYVFNLKQISLPSRQLRQVGSVSRELKSSHPGSETVTGIKWFEPLLVTAALASIIYLLWTTE